MSSPWQAEHIKPLILPGQDSSIGNSLHGPALIRVSVGGDAPEQILVSSLVLTFNWPDWQARQSCPLRAPGFDYEGADEPVARSLRRRVYGGQCRVRHPVIYQEAGWRSVFSALAVAFGIGLAQLFLITITPMPAVWPAH